MHVKDLRSALKDLPSEIPVYFGTSFEDKYIDLRNINLKMELDSPTPFIVINSIGIKLCEYKPSKVYSCAIGNEYV